MNGRRSFIRGGAAVAAGFFTGCAASRSGVADGRKYAVNASTLRTYGLSFLEQVRVVAASGFRGFEPWMKDVHAAIADGTFDEAKRIARDAGLEFVNGIAFGRWADPDPAVRAAGLAETKKDMLALKRLGCPRIAASMFGLQKPGAPKLTPDEIAERFRAVVALGRETGVTPLLEYWGHSVNMSTLEEALAVLAKAGCGANPVLADVYHTYRGGSFFGTFAKLAASQLPVLHVNDYTFAKPRGELADRDRVWPGDGEAPWSALFAMLRRVGADPWLSIELFRDEYCRTTPADTLAVGLRKLDALREKNALNLGVQMWSVDKLWRADPAGSFRRLRAMGYTGVQSLGFYTMDPNELSKMLAGEGLRIVDMPFDFKMVEKPDDFNRFLAFCRRFDIGFAYAPCFPWRANESEQRAYVEKLIALRPRFAAAGLRMGFHNHQKEFQVNLSDGRNPVERMIESGLDFELDVGHAKLAGKDPLLLLQRLAGRVPSIHAKPAGGLSLGGAGDRNDWSALLPEASASGARWAIVECETRRDTFEDVEKSIAFLKGLL